MKFQDALKELLKDPEFKREYERLDLKFELEKLWIKFKIFIYKLFKEE